MVTWIRTVPGITIKPTGGGLPVEYSVMLVCVRVVSDATLYMMRVLWKACTNINVLFIAV